MKEISVVLPVFNEAATLVELYRRTVSALESLDQDFELLFVDDGSQDHSPQIMRTLASEDDRVKVILLSRNFGQHYSIAAGLAHAEGKAVILMDADLQDLPEEIPKLVSALNQGYDIVYAVRKKRKDPFFRRLGAQIIFWMFDRLSECKIPRNISTFRILSRRAVDAFNRMPEHSRFTAGMMAWMGFEYTTVQVEHAERGSGRSRYDLWKLIRLSLDGIISFSDYPLKLASNLGIILSASSLLAGIYLIGRKLISGIVIPGYASLIVSILFLAGLQFFVMGIIGEYIVRIFRDVQGRPIYIIKEKINF